MKLAQFVISATPNDATWEFATALAGAATSRGVEAPIFAYSYPRELAGRLHRHAVYAQQSEPGDVLLFHAGAASPLPRYFVEHPAARDRRLVVYYHNITPPAFFEPFWPAIAVELRAAIEQTAGLAGRAALGVGASSFSVRDLERWGYPQVAVAPLVIDPSRYAPTGAAPEVVSPSPEAVSPSPTVLVVGRVSPNKAIEDVIRASVLMPELRVRVVGPTHSEAYQWALSRYRERIAADTVELCGGVDQSSLVAAYRDAACLLSLSRHEGFGVPLLEAMGFDVPVVALDAAAVAETCDGAALLLPSADPQLVAAACRRVVADSALRGRLVARGQWRYAQATAPEIADRALDTILG